MVRRVGGVCGGDGEFIDRYRPGVICERDGRVAGYAAVDEGGGTILLADPRDPVFALEALVAWLGERGHHEVDSYAADERRIAWLEAHGFTHRRSSFDLARGIDPPPASPVWPSAVAVARYRPGEDDEAVHALVYVDAAWAEVPGHTERSLEAWRSTITPDYNCWIARCILHSLAELLSRGATSLATGVQAENEKALGLYRDVGFVVEREWRVYVQ